MTNCCRRRITVAEKPVRFSLLTIDQESWEMRPVGDLFARTLARALGRQARPEEAAFSI